MGQAIRKHDFTAEEFAHFTKKLNDNLAALESLFAQPKFGTLKQRQIGCELELYLLNDQGRPVHENRSIIRSLHDKRFTLELNQYNLEYNLDPVALSGRPFQALEHQFDEAFSKLEQACQIHDCHALPIGILPTTRLSDFGPHAMTDLPRYHALTKQLKSIRGGPFHIFIRGEDTLELNPEDVTLEGANTSLQIHLQVTPEDFKDTFNTYQLITPLMIAFAANSPIAFGKNLWHETRIPLFKQSIDCRQQDPLRPEPARVNFGHGWVRDGAYELFMEAVRLYQPLLPIRARENPLKALEKGLTPKLSELRLQQGSVWLWNRPVFDPTGDGHLRIEARSLPAGPTKIDMLTNIALYLGLAEALRPNIHDLMSALPFEYCRRNFYRAAELGFDAELIWPSKTQHKCEYGSARDILLALIPSARDGLIRLGVDANEAETYVSRALSRVEKKQNGAQWQLDKYQQLKTKYKPETALKHLVKSYRTLSEENIPVADWPIT